MLAFFRATYVDFVGVVLCVAAMSISGLFYIIGGQYLVSKLWNLVPISGYARRHRRLEVRDPAGGDRRHRRHRCERGRWYRTIFLEEINKDYVRTARAKGLSEGRVLFRHVLHNALIPILTGVVVRSRRCSSAAW